MVEKEKWNQVTWVGFDLETSGAYPVGNEICEIAAVKWQAGEIVDQFESLICPTRPMSDFIIGIHGITNEMVAGAPRIEEKIGEFRSFIDDSYLIAHHAPFDLGFVAWEFEKLNLNWPHNEVLCSSLLSRKVIPESKNHKLQTLIEHLNIQKGRAHRALDDARACLEVALNCMQRMGKDVSREEVFRAQWKKLHWPDYSIMDLEVLAGETFLIDSIKAQEDVSLVYSGGRRKGQGRRVRPEGIVRNPDGDFLAAYCYDDKKVKRYYLNRVSSVNPI